MQKQYQWYSVISDAHARANHAATAVDERTVRQLREWITQAIVAGVSPDEFNRCVIRRLK
ncbi:TPA: hypothetical protein I8Y21_004715 [Klebsiella oxytoca]|uniref:Uncharacterized protein n=1 Tax=Klebsiella oxytoca TaxID=571 RepID=A0AAN5LC11_KLEOX|nr:hypothetical protein [Klebsiella oxytoca]